jgi:hypothetical protein
LRAARAFVAKVNGEQLRRIAQFPLTKAIRPNRTLKRWFRRTRLQIKLI